MNKENAIKIWKLREQGRLIEFNNKIKGINKAVFCDFLYYVIDYMEDESPLDILMDIQDILVHFSFKK